MPCPVRRILSLRTGSIQLDFNKARTESTCGPEQPLALPDVLCQNCSFAGNLASAGPIISSPPKALFWLNESADTGMYDSDVAFSVRVGVRDGTAKFELILSSLPGSAPIQEARQTLAFIA